MMKVYSIYQEVQSFCDEDSTNYETDEINKENMNEFCNHFILI